MEVAYLRRVGLGVATDRPSHLLRAKGFADMVAAPAKAVAGSSGGGSASCTATPASAPAKASEPSRGAGFEPGCVQREGHPPWLQPSTGVNLGLCTRNSLTGETEPFVPLEGKKVRWYTCGPTVYDASHVGHARAYLTFDILRRIMANYFKYDVRYHINITDIDDKIILRSRQNKLYKDFCAEASKLDSAAMQAFVDEAVELAGQKLQAKQPKEPAADASEKDRLEYTKLSQEHLLKLSQHEELKRRVAAVAGTKEVLEAARDPLMGKLDKERGHTVSDHSVFDSHARRFENEYFEDMDALGVLRPDVVTRISEYMDGRVQRFIERLEDLGMAYASQGSVYFSIDAFKNLGYTYRKLVPAACVSAAEMEEGEGALATEDAEKRNPNDFALWKKSKPGEPFWDGPRWGPGRPGWHIECSVMALDINGEFLDIHAGGEDLKFPHHDNEMAQSEAYLGRQQWTNYFWHAGHLHIEGLKMSKSLKNFITIRQALQFNTARQLRLMFLMQPWDKGLNYSDQALDMAKAEERKFKHFLGSLKFLLRRPHGQDQAGERERSLLASVASCEEGIGVALRDNFNTSKVIDLLSRLVTDCHQSFDALPSAGLEPVSKAAELVVQTLTMLGVEGLDVTRPKEEEWTKALDVFSLIRHDVRGIMREKAGFSAVLEAAERASPAAKAADAVGLDDCAQALRKFAEDLQELARTEKPPSDVLRRCDEVRDRDFVELGVRLEDRGSEGFAWMFDEPESLKKELQEQAEKAAEASQQKLANKLQQKRQELKSAEKAIVKPDALFSTGANSDLYAAFDEAGLPTKLANGEDLSAKKKKDLAKELAKQQKDNEKLLKLAGPGGVDAYLAKLHKEVADLEHGLVS